MTARTDPAPEKPPRSRGLPSALWSLWGPDAFDSRPPTHRKLSFQQRQGRGVRPRADVYLPDGAGPHPSVMLIHGGGFVIGSRKMKPMRFLATRLCEAGFAVTPIDYRLIFRGGRLEEQLADVAAAWAWWRSSADEYGLDPARMSMLGISAGAALTLLHASRSEAEGLERVVSVYGLYDFTWLGGAMARWMRKLVLRTRDSETWRAQSPLERCEVPVPLLLIHGTADLLVPLEQCERLAARREELGLETATRVYPDQPHGFLNDATRQATDEAVSDILEFLRG